MAGHVDVVLREDIDNLGHSGEVVRVRPGYARNYLLPRGLAVIATRGKVAQLEHEMRAARQRAEKVRGEARGTAAALAELTLQIEKQAGGEGKLFGSVTAVDIAEALKAKGYAVDRRKIVLSEPIKQVGTYDVAAKLAPGIAPSFKVEVVSAA